MRYLLTLFAITACTPDPLLCNGHEHLCDRPFDEVVFAVAHNGMSNAEDGWTLPNQQWSLQSQLDAGVRGFMLDTYEQQGEVLLCHVVCAVGSIKLVEAMGIFRDFLDANPGEVITFMIESRAPAASTEAAFRQADALRLTHAQAEGEPWPTLGELVEADGRLVVFHEGSDASVDWFMPGYEHYVWDTDYSASSADDFGCEVLRGKTEHSIYLMNHFLTSPTASAKLADQVNFNPLLEDRVAQCAEESGQAVDWIAVDFIDRGHTLAVVDALNAL